MNRGDVVITYVSHVGSQGGSKRPALVVQSDTNNTKPLKETKYMNITKEQLASAERGRPVQLTIDGKEFVLISRDVYDRVKHAMEYDDSEWTDEERSRMAARTFEEADEAGPIS